MASHHDPYENATLCTHCGYCLPDCPTYRVENDETHSPRGRVSILLALRAGELTAEEASEPLSHCLVCRACHQSCPVGVRPGKLVLNLRSRQPLKTPVSSHLLHWVTNSPLRTAWAAQTLSWYRKSGLQGWVRTKDRLRFFPALARFEALIPQDPQQPLSPLPDSKLNNTARPHVLLLSGCISRLFWPQISALTSQLLKRCGFRVTTHRGFGCCGAPFRESGDRKRFLRQARRTLDAFQSAGSVDVVLCDSAVCAVTVRSYARAMANIPSYAALAKRFTSNTQDLNSFLLAHLPPLAPTTASQRGQVVTYQDHCQTRFGLGITEPPRRLLATLPVRFQEMPAAGTCCGAGGEYMLRHPAISHAIRKEKLAAIVDSGAEVVVGNNPGCLLNLEAGLRALSSPVRVRHMTEQLWEVYGPSKKQRSPT